MKIKILLILSCLSFTSYSWSSDQYFYIDGIRFPRDVDLSYLLRMPRQKQFGGSCHVFAATALVESTCKRLVHRDVNISETYLFYRHIRERLIHATRSAPERKGNLSSVDGGTIYATLKRITNRDYLLESEFPYDSDFVSEMRLVLSQINLQKEIELFLDLIDFECTPLEDELLVKMCNERVADALNKSRVYRPIEEVIKELDDLFIRRFNELKRRNFIKVDGAKNKTQSSILNRGHYFYNTALDKNNCLKKITSYKSLPFNSKLALILLSKGLPFVCSGNVKYGQFSGRHGLVFVGHHYDQIKRRIVWKALDSNTGSINEFVGNCKIMDIIL